MNLAHALAVCRRFPPPPGCVSAFRLFRLFGLSPDRAWFSLFPWSVALFWIFGSFLPAYGFPVFRASPFRRLATPRTLPWQFSDCAALGADFVVYLLGISADLY